MTDMREIVVERDMMVPARDVVLLATDVYRPAGPRPYPVLLCGRRVRAFFLAQYDLDRSTPAARAAFIARVRARIARIS